MPRELNTFVHVSDDAGEAHVFGPGDKVPAWASKKIGDHCFDSAASKSSGSDES